MHGVEYMPPSRRTHEVLVAGQREVGDRQDALLRHRLRVVRNGGLDLGHVQAQIPAASGAVVSQTLHSVCLFTRLWQR